MTSNPKKIHLQSSIQLPQTKQFSKLQIIKLEELETVAGGPIAIIRKEG